MHTLAQVAMDQTASLGYTATSSPRAIPGARGGGKAGTGSSIGDDEQMSGGGGRGAMGEEEVDVVSMDTSTTNASTITSTSTTTSALHTLAGASSEEALRRVRTSSSSAPNSPALTMGRVDALPVTLSEAHQVILELKAENARLQSVIMAANNKNNTKKRAGRGRKGRSSLDFVPGKDSHQGPPSVTVSGPSGSSTLSSSFPSNLDAMTAAIAMTSVASQNGDGPPSPSPHPKNHRGNPSEMNGSAAAAGNGFKLSSSWSPGSSFLTGSSPPGGLLAKVFHHRRSNSAVSAGSASATLAGMPSSLSSNGSNGSDRSPPGNNKEGGGGADEAAESPHLSMMPLSLNEVPKLKEEQHSGSPRLGGDSPTLSAKSSPRIIGGVTRRRNKSRPSLSTASSNTSMVYSPGSASVPSGLVPTPFEYGSGCVCFSMGAFHAPTHPYPTGMSLVKRVPKRGNQPNEYFMTTSTGLDGELRFTVTAGEHSETATKLGAALGPVLNAQGRVRLSGPHFFCLHDVTLNRRLKVLADWQAQNQSVVPL